LTVAAEPTFLDTNVLVYASVDASPFHTAALSVIAALEQSNVQHTYQNCFPDLDWRRG